MNYLDLINIKYSFKKRLFAMILVFILFTIYILNLNMPMNYSSYGYNEDGLVVVKLPIDNPDIIDNLEYIKIGSKSYKAKVQEISDVILDKENFINYQIVKFKINKRSINNETFRLDIFYNKEKVYKKLKKILF